MHIFSVPFFELFFFSYSRCFFIARLFRWFRALLLSVHIFFTHFTNALNEKDYHLAIRDFRCFMLFLGLKYFHLLCTFIKCYIFMGEIKCLVYYVQIQQETKNIQTIASWLVFLHHSFSSTLDFIKYSRIPIIQARRREIDRKKMK